MADMKTSLEKGEKTAKNSSVIVALIGLVKGIVGVLSGSISLIAQAIDSLTDVVSSLTVYIGLRLAQKKPTEKFPYGYYRAETFASLIVSVFIIVSGILILRESVMRFLQPEVISYPFIAMLAAAFSIPFLYFLAKYNKKVGEEINSQALVGEGKNFTYDVYSSILVFIGILSLYFGVPWIEPTAGVVISIFILKNGVELGRDSILTLMDAVLKPEHLRKIKEIAEGVQGVVGVHDIKIRKSGPFCFGEMHMEVEKDLSVDKAHAISEEVEQKAKQECKELEKLIIHIEPVKRTRLKVAIPVDNNRGLESKAIPHFADASYFLIVDVDEKQIKNWSVKQNPGAKLNKKKGITAAKFLIDEKVNTLIVGELGEGPFHVLRDSFVEMYKLSGDTAVKEIVEMLLKGELEKVVSPLKT